MKILSASIALLILFQACSGSSVKAPSDIIIAKLNSGASCFPVKFNNSEQVALQCTDGNRAIWSKEHGIQTLPQAPVVLSISPPNIPLDLSVTGFSDDGKMLLNPTAPFDYPNIEQIPPFSYLYDGSTYIKLDGTFDALSDNGQYLAGIGANSQLSLLHNLKPVRVALLPGLSAVFVVKAVNNKGEVAATVSYGDSKHTFSNYYATKISQTESEIYPPALRPDINSSSAVDINDSGVVLMDSIEQSDNPRGRALIVDSDNITDIFPEKLSADTIGLALNNNNVALFSIDGQVFVYEEGKETKSLEDRVGQAVEGYTYLLNNNNQVLVDGGSESEFLILNLQ